MKKTPYIEIKRIKVDGLYEFDKEFEPGLHILVGETNSCGKSLFIKFIDFALGDDGRELKGYKILKQCSFFYADLDINGKQVSIKRNIYIIDNKIELFFNTSIKEIITKNLTPEKVIQHSEFQEMLLKEITGYETIPIVSSKGEKKKITFPVFTNLFYLNQGVEAGQIFRYPTVYFPKYVKEKVFSLYFNTKQIQKTYDEVKSQDLKREINEAKKELNVKRVFFNTNFSSDNYYAENEKKVKLQNEIQRLNKILTNLNDEVLTSDDISDEDINKVSSLKRDLENIEKFIVDSELTIKQNARILNDYREEIEKIEKNIRAFDIFKKFDIKICPECSKLISKNNIKCCQLCKESLEEDDDTKIYFKKNLQYLNYLKDAADNTLDIISHDEEKQNELLKSKENIIEQIKRLEKKINEKMERTRVPLVEKVSKISSLTSRKEQQIEEIDRKLRVLESFLHEDKKIKGIENEIKKLDENIRLIEKDEEDRKRESYLLEKFEQNLNHFFNDDNYPFFVSAKITDSFDIEITSESEGTLTLKNLQSASNKIVSRLGFFYSILRTAIEENLNHPKILYLDSPKDQELQWSRFCSSLLKYKELLNGNNDRGQVFITVTEDGKNIIKDSYEELEKYVFMKIKNKKGYRLLRPEKKN